MFTLTINTSNAAFELDQCAEIAVLLRKLARDIDDGRDNASSYDGAIRDTNGHTVGEWTVDAR